MRTKLVNLGSLGVKGDSVEFGHVDEHSSQISVPLLGVEPLGRLGDERPDQHKTREAQNQANVGRCYPVFADEPEVRGDVDVGKPILRGVPHGSQRGLVKPWRQLSNEAESYGLSGCTQGSIDEHRGVDDVVSPHFFPL